MKKPSFAVPQQAIQDRQNELKAHAPVFHPRDHLIGWCQENQGIAKRFDGAVYDTEQASSHGESHTVGVVSTRGSRGGYVVDITQEKGIVGVVENITDESSVAQVLTQALGVGGWQRRR